MTCICFKVITVVRGWWIDGLGELILMIGQRLAASDDGDKQAVIMMM